MKISPRNCGIQAQNKTSATKSKQRSLGLFWFVKKIVLVRKSFD